MAIEKYLTPDYLFDPTPVYDGSWLFELDNLKNLSLPDGKSTLFQKFYENTFINPLSQIFKNSKGIVNFPMGMVCCPNKNGIGRKLTYSKYHFFSGLLGYLSQNIDIGKLSEDEFKKQQQKFYEENIEKDSNELNEIFAQKFKEKCDKLQDLINNEIESIYFDDATKDYLPLKDRIDFTTYLKNMYREMYSIYTGLLTLGDFFEKPLPYHDLAACFDPDTFYLMFAKIIYEFNIKREREENNLSNSYVFLYNYEEALQEVVKENRKYDPKITFILENGKRIRYTRWTFKDEFMKMQARHPDIKPIVLPEITESNRDNYREIGIMQKLHALYNSQNAEVNWEFLPQETMIKKSNVIVNSQSLKNTDKKDLAALQAETDERINILDNSNYLMRIKGKNSFSGYYAFVYSTGAVILEKFWQNPEKLIPAKEEATYVMNIDNFIEMSKLSKLVLIEFMREIDDLGVKRIFHTSVNNWHSNIYKAINGVSYDLHNVLRFIDRLIREEESERTNE